MLSPPALLEAARFIEQTRASFPRERLGLAGGHNIGHHACTVRDYGTRGRWQGCPGGVTSVGICSDGAVKGCLSMSPCEVQGNIHERPLLELWRDPQRFARIRHYAPGRLTGKCGSCPHGSTCRGGCPEMARTATGDVWDNPFCLRQAEQA
jgi:radical SAM protein with 4Fe4S-binding SPASM domain